MGEVLPYVIFMCIYTPKVQRLEPENGWFPSSESPFFGGADFQVNHVKLQLYLSPFTNIRVKKPTSNPKNGSISGEWVVDVCNAHHSGQIIATSYEFPPQMVV